MAKLDMNLPESGDEELYVAHLGMFKNGSTYDITDEQVAFWEQESKQKWPEGGTLKMYNPDAPAPPETPAEPAEPEPPKPKASKETK